MANVLFTTQDKLNTTVNHQISYIHIIPSNFCAWSYHDYVIHLMQTPTMMAQYDNFVISLFFGTNVPKGVPKVNMMLLKILQNY